MLIIRLLAPLLLALLAWWGLRNIKNRYALTSSQFRWLVGITAMLMVVVILILFGRLPIQALLAPFIFMLSFMMRNVHLLIRLWPLLRMGQSKWASNRNWGRSGGNKPGASGIRTPWLDMSLDHQTGNMDGEILQGALAGHSLSSLEMAQLLALATACGAAVMVWFKRTNPWFMGALLVSMGLTLSGLQGSAVPVVLSNAAQLVIGVSLGVRFQREFVHTAPRWLASVAMGTLVMMLLSLGFGLFLAHTTGLHPATLILGTSPGGIAEMAITAKVLQLGVPVVTAFQVCRLVAVLILVGPIFRIWVKPDKPR